jgi:hypothetical protein
MLIGRAQGRLSPDVTVIVQVGRDLNMSAREAGNAESGK